MKQLQSSITIFVFFAVSIFEVNAASLPPTIPVDPNRKTVLMADDTCVPVPGIEPFMPSKKPFQRFYVQGTLGEVRTFEWKVQVPADGDYEVELFSKGISEAVVTGGSQPLHAMVATPSAWSRAPLGTVSLKAGELTVSLQVVKGDSISMRSIDLLPVKAKADYQKRVEALRSDTSWMVEGKYGVMLQYGGWGYSQQGDKNPWEEVVKNFDVERFAKMVDEDMGAKWVIWSITWRDSHFPMPLKSVDAIVPDHTTIRDLPADLIKALKKRSIKLMFYYHPGHEDPTWWAANWGKDDGQGHGDKDRFLANWKKVMIEIGNRYGDDLAGWFYDDAILYSPAPFEALTKAAKTGSAKRLVSYNNWVLPRATDFQDVHMGEMSHQNFPPNPADIDERGIYKSGPNKGIQAHNMSTVNSPGWGVWQPNSGIPLSMNASQAIAMAKLGASRKEAITYNFDMYEDGTVTEETLDMFRQLKKAIRSQPPLSEGMPGTVSSQWDAQYGPALALDGNPDTFWSLAQNAKTGWLEVDLSQESSVSRVVIQEGVAAPRKPLITQFAVAALQNDGTWKPVAHGAGIGNAKELVFAPVKSKKFRLQILNSAPDPSGSAPVIEEFQLFAK